LHGLFLVLERPFLQRSNAIPRHLLLTGSIRALRILLVFSCVSLAWVLFKLPDLSHATAFLSGMFVPHQIGAPAHIYRSLALIYSLPVIVQHLTPQNWLATSGRRLEPYLYGAMAALAFLDAGPDTSFIYFQF
jgi:alginate O-acetyltransferase complex protein AlgI